MDKITHLDNGIAVITAHNPNVHSVTLMVGVKAGSRYESPEIEGMSHFLEHMMFKGTPKRPNSNAVTIELDRYGAEHNASTGKHKTLFYIKIASAQQALALDIISDIYMNPLFKEDDIESEKDIVCEEIASRSDDHHCALFELSDKVMFQGSTLGNPIAGTQEGVRAFTREQLLAYRNARYASNTTVVVLAGNFSDETFNKVCEIFSALSKVEDVGYTKFDQTKITLPEFSKLEKDVKQVSSMIRFFAPSETSNERYASNLLACILGGYSSSRLFQKIREENGLCYSIGAFNYGAPDVGSFIVNSETDDFDSLYEKVIEELKLLKSEGITEDELDRAKSYIQGTTALSSEDSMNVANFYAGRYLSKSDFRPLAEEINIYNNITVSDVNNVANSIFDFNKFNVSMVVPRK